MSGCFSLGALLLLVEIYFLGSLKTSFSLFKRKSFWPSFYAYLLSYSSFYQLVRGYGLMGCWFALVGFQWVRPTNILITPTCKIFDLFIQKNKSSFRHGFYLHSGAFFLLTACCTLKTWANIIWGSLKPLSFRICEEVIKFPRLWNPIFLPADCSLMIQSGIFIELAAKSQVVSILRCLSIWLKAQGAR